MTANELDPNNLRGDSDFEEEVFSRIYPTTKEFKLFNVSSTELPRNHQILLNYLSSDVKNDEELTMIFYLATYLSDPYVQPEENDEVVLSLDLLADVLLALTYQYYSQADIPDLQDADSETMKFAISTKFFILAQEINNILLVHDEVGLRYCEMENYDQMKGLFTYWKRLNSMNTVIMRLMFPVLCLLHMAIFKCFVDPNDFDGHNLSLNPYLSYMVRIWKGHTNILILLLTLEGSTLWEKLLGEYHEGKEFVRVLLKGSSAVRCTLAYILNQNPSLNLWDSDDIESDGEEDLNLLINHDIKNETLLNFMEPLARECLNGGALLVDMRMIVMAQYYLTAGSLPFEMWEKENKNRFLLGKDAAIRLMNREKNLNQLGDLLVDLDYDDRFDEELRYILEVEYADTDEEFEEENEGENEHKGTRKHDTRTSSLPMRVLEKDAIETDHLGRDWRDEARDANRISTAQFMKDAEHPEDENLFYQNWSSLENVFERMLEPESADHIIENEGKRLINTVALSIRSEEYGSFTNDITPDKIYELLSLLNERDKMFSGLMEYPISNFEVILKFHTLLACKIMDEMFMCRGYRRTFVWFLTNNVNYSLILLNYIFELLTNLRGRDDLDGLNFTREGDHVILSDVEILMFLHLLFTNVQSYLNSFADNHALLSLRKKFIEVLCLMIRNLIERGTIVLGPRKDEKDYLDDYANDLLSLLVSWISIPAARELYFSIRNELYGGNQESTNLESDEKSEYYDLEMGADWESNKNSPYVLDDLRYLMPPTGGALPENFKETITDLLTSEDRFQLLRVQTNNRSQILMLYKIPLLLMGVHIRLNYSFVPDDVMPLPTGIDHWQAMQVFFRFFNVLSSMEDIPLLLFDRIHRFIGNLEKFRALAEASPDQDKESEESIESEFNDKFLNGEVEYSSPLDDKLLEKKSKKKKKKKKSKHK